MANGDSFWKGFYDNMWALLALGLGIPIVVYTVWGLIEILNVPRLPVN